MNILSLTVFFYLGIGLGWMTSVRIGQRGFGIEHNTMYYAQVLLTWPLGMYQMTTSPIMGTAAEMIKDAAAEERQRLMEKSWPPEDWNKDVAIAMLHGFLNSHMKNGADAMEFLEKLEAAEENDWRKVFRQFKADQSLFVALSDFVCHTTWKKSEVRVP